jgi:hypothetical protein
MLITQRRIFESVILNDAAALNSQCNMLHIKVRVIVRVEDDVMRLYSTTVTLTL